MVLIAIAMVAAAEPIAIEVFSAQAVYDRRTNEPMVSFRMSEASTQRFAELTSRNVGRKLEIRVDGRTIAAPIIRSPILGGSGQIAQSSWRADEAKALAALLSSGAAKLEVEVVD